MGAKRARAGALLGGFFALFSVVLLPAVAAAVSNTASTTVSATIASVISISSNSTVAVSVTPTSGGVESAASDTVTVSTNNTAGYKLTLADSDATTTLTSGSNTIAATSNTYASPATLTGNSWGYGVAGVGSFSSSYAAESNASSSTYKWAGMPASGSPQQIKTTSTTANSDTTTIWYAVRATSTQPNGTYSDTITYTATTN